MSTRCWSAGLHFKKQIQGLCILHSQILRTLRPVNKMLQSEAMNLADAVNFVVTILNLLKQMRTPETFNIIWKRRDDKEQGV